MPANTKREQLCPTCGSYRWRFLERFLDPATQDVVCLSRCAKDHTLRVDRTLSRTSRAAMFSEEEDEQGHIRRVS